MVSGFDRYFRSRPVSAHEDARADRSPGEFYQLDIEMSFVTRDDVFAAVEPVLRDVFEEFSGGKPVTKKFPTHSIREAMLKYGSDKPDLRNPIVIADVSEEFGLDAVEFKAFKNVIKQGGVVARNPGAGGGRPAALLFRQAERVGALRHGRTGAWLYRVRGRRRQRSIAKFIPADVQQKIAAKAGVKLGDAVFFAADKPPSAAKLARCRRARKSERNWHFLARITSNSAGSSIFPMYEWKRGGEEDRLLPQFHSRCRICPPTIFLALDAKDKDKILALKAIQYDIVCNGVELSSGAIRNHRPDVMRKAFAIAGYGEEVLEQKIRRHAARVELRRAAAWRDRARHRPYRHASVRRRKPARGGAFPMTSRRKTC